jgi:protein-S-isoprenylcysteine O-methyltransferase Ste14
MERMILFTVLSIPLVIISWRTLFNIRSHGFYRFFSWECILWLLASNYSYWFISPFSLWQILSWIFLFISVVLVVAGVVSLKKSGKPDKGRTDNSLYQFEKTSQLVTSGIFRYIRHPLYSSLLFLTWGIYFKQPSPILTMIAILSSALLIVTSVRDEIECIAFFGDIYSEYKSRTKRFIPYIF